MNMTIEQILKDSPIIKDWENKKWAFYSTNCCWWTSFPEDLGDIRNFMGMKKITYYTTGNDGKKRKHTTDVGSLPCCPHCGSPLMQAPLEKFIEYAKGNPSHYGRLGMDTFCVTHERNSRACFRQWQAYEIFIQPFGKDGE